MMADLFDMVTMNKHLIKEGESWVSLTVTATALNNYITVMCTYIAYNGLQ